MSPLPPLVGELEGGGSKRVSEHLPSRGSMALGEVCPVGSTSSLGGPRVWEGIDRMFATPSWIQCYPGHIVHHLVRIASGHCPVLLSTDTSFSYHAPFKFKKFWLAYPQS